MDNTIQYIINISQGNSSQTFNNIANGAATASGRITGLMDAIQTATNKAFAFNQVSEMFDRANASIDNFAKPGMALNETMAELSAITGVTGSGLAEIEKNARATALAFGGSAAANAESYKLILSKLNPEIAKSPVALKAMGDSVAILSKGMGGDAVGATNALTTAMNQFQVSTVDPIAAAREMAVMSNIMAAAAKEGSAEMPQITEALEASGMAAKTANVSFAETNAAIQVLDKAGKKGAEGGVALRNIMAILGKGRFMEQAQLEALEGAGINVNRLSDKSLTLSERLDGLKKVVGDGAMMTKIFGMENQGAAMALISGTSEMDRYTMAIQNTTSAEDQARIIMGSRPQQLSRIAAKFDDLKISIFNATQGALPYFKAFSSVIQSATGIMMFLNVASAFTETAYYLALKKRTSEMWSSVRATFAGITANGTYVPVALGAAVASHVFAKSLNAIGTAIYSIPIVGWIVLGVTLLIGAFTLLWAKSEKFRQVIFGIWESAKAVFYNIGIVVMALWDNVLKPYIMFFWNLYKMVFNAIWDVTKWCYNAIGDGLKAVADFFVSVWNGIVATVVGAWNWVVGIVSSAIGWITGIMGNLWKWFTDSSSAIGAWLYDNILGPIKNVFTEVWDWISSILDKVIDKMGSAFGWIKELWNKIFPKDKFKDVASAFDQGKALGSESWANSQKKKDEESGAGVSVSDVVAGVPSAKNTATSLGGGGSLDADSKSVASGGTKSTNITINVNKEMVGQITVNPITMSQGVDEIRDLIMKSLGQIVGSANRIATN